MYLSKHRIFYYFVRRLSAAYQSRISCHILRNCVSVHKDKFLRNFRTDMFYSRIALETKLDAMLHGTKCWWTDALTFSYPLRKRGHRLQNVLRIRKLRAAAGYCHFHVVFVAEWVVLGYGVWKFLFSSVSTYHPAFRIHSSTIDAIQS